MRILSRRWGLLVVAVAVLVTGAVAAPTASATDVAQGDSVWIGPRQGYPGTGVFPVYLQTPADPANPGEPDYWAYCVEHDVSAVSDTEGTVTDPGDYLGANHFDDPVVQGRVGWVLQHSYPAVTLADLGAAAGATGLGRDDAIEATQYAIWNFTDLWSDPTTPWPWQDADSEAVYHYLVDGALANGGVTAGDLAATVGLSGPSSTVQADGLVGPFVVSTDQATAQVSVTGGYALTDASGTPVDATTVVDGQEVYLDLRGVRSAGQATVSASVVGGSGAGSILSVPVQPGSAPTVLAHAQSLILVAAAGRTSTDSVDVTWAAAPVPTLSTTLVDAADHDHALPSDGGTATDTVTYRNLVPGTEYTISGALVRAPGAGTTGITVSVTFTPTTSDGSVDVTFTVPGGHAGQTLVAFEQLFTGPRATGTVVAEHRDIADAGQTVTVAKAAASTPSPSTTPSSSPTSTTPSPTTPTPTTSTPTTTTRTRPTATGTPSGGSTPGTAGALAETGASLGPAVYLGALGLLVGGGALIAVARSERRRG